MNAVSVGTGPNSDRVTVRNAKAPALTLNTEGGADQVVVLSTGIGSTTTINLGDDEDSLEVRTTGQNSTVTAFGGNGADAFRVAGGTRGGDVEIHGDDPTTEPGDSLTIDSEQLTTGSGTVANVVYDGIELPAAPTVTFTATAGGPYTVSEGESVTLGASSPDATGTLTYAWDLDGDGEFADATDASPTIDWNTLRSVGIDDDGDYPISVRISDTAGNFTVDTGILAVTNTEPTLSVSGSPTVEAGSPLTLDLSATDPGNDKVITWTIHWGDDTTDVYTAGQFATVASHVYSTTRQRTITTSPQPMKTIRIP